MTLKELIEQYSYQNEGVYTLIDIENLCKEYAKICLEKAAEKATIYFADEDWQWNTSKIKVSKKSITNIELP